MKYARTLVVVALVTSVIGNIFLYRRMNNMRLHVKVNEHQYSRGLLYQWLEQRHGDEMTAKIVLFELVTRAAEKAGIPPNKADIEVDLKELQDTNPVAARRFKLMPWIKEDWKQDREISSALVNLSTKDVKATDDELRDHFAQNPGKWDKADLVYFKGIAANTADAAAKAKELMEKVGDLNMVGKEVAPQAGIIGVDGTWAFRRPVGGKLSNPAMNAAADAPDRTSPPYNVIIVPFQKQFLVLRKDHVVPGKKVAFEDVKDKVSLDYKLARAIPQDQVLRKLWDESNILTDDPAQKQRVEMLLFPQRFLAGETK